MPFRRAARILALSHPTTRSHSEPRPDAFSLVKHITSKEYVVVPRESVQGEVKTRTTAAIRGQEGVAVFHVAAGDVSSMNGLKASLEELETCTKVFEQSEACLSRVPLKEDESPTVNAIADHTDLLSIGEGTLKASEANDYVESPVIRRPVRRVLFDTPQKSFSSEGPSNTIEDAVDLISASPDELVAAADSFLASTKDGNDNQKLTEALCYEVILEEPLADAVEAKQSQQNWTPSKGSRRRHVCLFCRKTVMNFSRHLRTKHQDEQRVQEWMSYNNSPEKLVLLRKIMGQGDSTYNKKHPTTPIVMKSSKKMSERICCYSCKCLVSIHNYYRHIAHCDPQSSRNVKKGELEKAKRNTVDRFCQGDLSEDLKALLWRLHNGECKDIIMNNPLVLEHAQMLVDKYTGESQYKLILMHIRTIAKFVLLMKAKTAVDCFLINSYKDFEEAVKTLSGWKKGPDSTYAAPSTVDQYGRIFRAFAKTVHFHFESVNKFNEAEKVVRWMNLFDNNFSDRIGYVARKQADRKTFEKRQEIPTQDDVCVLIDYVKSNLETSFSKLIDTFDQEAHETLTKLLLLKVWIFNRKRVREVDRVRLTDWYNAKEIDTNSDEYKTLDSSEQLYANSFRRICVRGKLGRMVAMIVPKEDVRYFDVMILNREASGVDPSNPFLFAKGHTFVEGTGVMREASNLCGARRPDLLRGTKLRKQLAASMQYVNLTKEDLRQVAETLGHTLDTHMKFYRHPMPALHLGRVSKLLCALNDGQLEKYRGRSLDEIDSSPEKKLERASSETSFVTAVSSEIEEETELAPKSPINESPLDIDEHTASETFTAISSPSTSDDAEPGPSNVVTLLRKQTKCTSDSESESDLESEEDLDGEVTPNRKRAHAKRLQRGRRMKWSDRLLNVLKSEFKDYIQKNKVPPMSFIKAKYVQLLPKHNELFNTSPKKMTIAVSNIIQKNKKK